MDEQPLPLPAESQTAPAPAGAAPGIHAANHHSADIHAADHHSADHHTPFSFISLLRDVIVSIVLAVVLIVFIYQPVKVEGTSMMPGLTDQERIFINKYVYKLSAGAVERDDLVVFHYPYDPSQSYIKRVIGLPGDTIQVDDGTVYVNGARLDEPYVPEEYRDHMSVAREVVPPDHYFVLGDHRSSSNDSRIWGFVDRKEIYGKAVFVYWPPDKIGRVR